MDELFEILAAPDETRGRLSLIMLTGPSGTGKTLGPISAACAANRGLTVVTVTDLPRPGMCNRRLFLALDTALLPARGGVVLLRSAEALVDEYAAALAAYLVCRVFKAVRGHKLIVVTAPDASNELFRMLLGQSDVSDSGVMRRLYFRSPLPKDINPALVKWWPDLAVGSSRQDNCRLLQLRNRMARECRGDLRRLHRWSKIGGDIDYSGASGRNRNSVDVDANPFVIVPRLLGGIKNQLRPIATEEERDGARRAMAQHDTSETIDVLFENWVYVTPFPRVGPLTDEQKCDMSAFADDLSDADIIGRWRECGGLDDTDPTDEDEYAAAIVVSAAACRFLNWTPFYVGARRSHRMENFASTATNRELMIQQRLEQRGLNAFHYTTEQARLHPETTACHKSMLEMGDDLAFDMACSAVKGKRPLTASQALSGPVYVQRD
jgi:hypothetical protein